MKLNHLNLTVSDVVAVSTLFEKHFEFTCVDRKGDNMLVVLYGKDDFILTLMSDTFNKNGSNSYPEAFHFGFILSSEEDVTALYHQLKADGLTIERAPAKIRNSFGFYFHYNGLMIEIGYYFK